MVATLKATLRKRLRNAEAIALLGVGSELRGDDVAGIMAVEAMNKYSAKINKEIKFKCLIGGTAPENLTGKIKEFNPTHLIIIDSAEIGKRPGTITIFNPDETVGVSFSTHSLPLKVMSDYLRADIGCEIMIIGIQPKAIKFGQLPSKEVRQAVGRIAAVIKAVLQSD